MRKPAEPDPKIDPKRPLERKVDLDTQISNERRSRPVRVAINPITGRPVKYY